MYINLFPFNPSIPRSLSSNGNGQWAETVLTEARKDFDVIIKKVKLDLFLWGGGWGGVCELSGLAYQCLYTNRIFKSIER